MRRLLARCTPALVAGVVVLPTAAAVTAAAAPSALAADAAASPTAAPTTGPTAADPPPTNGSDPGPSSSPSGPCLPPLCGAPAPTPTSTATSTAPPRPTATATAAPVATATAAPGGGSGTSGSGSASTGSRVASGGSGASGSTSSAATSGGFPDGVWTLVPGGGGEPAADAATTPQAETQAAARSKPARDPVTSMLGLAVVVGVVLGAVGAAGLWATRHRGEVAPDTYAARHAGPR